MSKCISGVFACIIFDFFFKDYARHSYNNKTYLYTYNLHN